MNCLKDQQNPLISILTEKYQEVIENNLRKRETQLIHELFQKAKKLKQQLAFYKHQASHQNIDKLIGQRRREKQKQRQGLQTRWRECAQSFKHMQEEQKALLNQQKENIFDIQNLQSKISEFKLHTQRIKSRLSKLQNNNHEKFITEIKENYHSPYQNRISTPQRSLNTVEWKKNLLAQSQKYLFSTKYQLSHPKGRTQCINQNSDSSQTRHRPYRNIPKHNNGVSLNQEAFRGINQKKGDSERENSRLSMFLSNKEVRLKIFKLLRKHM